jgi:hypothetical protein
MPDSITVSATPAALAHVRGARESVHRRGHLLRSDEHQVPAPRAKQMLARRATAGTIV